MKTTVALTTIVLALTAITLVSGATQTQKTLYQKAYVGLTKVPTRVVSNTLRGRLGDDLSAVNNDRLDEVVGQMKKVIVNSQDYQEIKAIAKKVRNKANVSQSELSDEQIDNLVRESVHIGSEQKDATDGAN